ncbi:hypothetical protein ACFL96_19570, partial [Thermoproteota archaeon]
RKETEYAKFEAQRKKEVQMEMAKRDEAREMMAGFSTKAKVCPIKLNSGEVLVIDDKEMELYEAGGMISDLQRKEGILTLLYRVKKGDCLISITVSSGLKFITAIKRLSRIRI